MDYVFLLISLFFVAVGVFGCVVRGIPGPPFSFLALLFLNFSQAGQIFPILPIVAAAVIVLMAWIPDFFVPWWHEKMYEISHTTTWGALLGMIAGFFLFPPVGIGIGIIIGSVIGELIAKKEMRKKLDEEGFTIAGVMTAMITKLTISAVMTYYYFVHFFTLDLNQMIQKFKYDKFIDWFQIFFK